MQTIPLLYVGSSLEALSPVASAEQRVNVFYDIHQDGDKQSIIVRGTPGTVLFCQLPQAPIRGMLAIGTNLYVVADNGLYIVGATGNFSLLGYFGFSGQNSPVAMSNNPNQLIIVDGTNGGWIYNFSALQNAVTVIVGDIQSELIDVTALAQEYKAVGSTPTGGSAKPSNPGVLPRVVTPRFGADLGGKL